MVRAVPPGLGDSNAGGRWTERLGPMAHRCRRMLGEVQGAPGDSILALPDGSGEVGSSIPESSRHEAGHHVCPVPPLPAGPFFRRCRRARSTAAGFLDGAHRQLCRLRQVDVDVEPSVFSLAAGH
jgi:hypothetical protein